jgi:uncharacterized protein (TIRG00374 family)
MFPLLPSATNHSVNAIARRLIDVARYLLPLLILGWLFQKLWRDDQQSVMALYENARHWPTLLLAIAVYLTAIIGTFLRWYLLVVALHLPFRKIDAIRLGFIGYLLQFVSLGSVGGDVFKAVFIAKEQPERKPEAVATVLVDRLIGLFSLALLACVTFAFLTGEELGKLRGVRTACFVIAAIGSVTFALAFLTRFSLLPLARRLSDWKRVRAALIRVQAALDLYRDHRSSVLLAVAIGIATHFLHALAIYLAATAVFPLGPDLLQQMGMWVIAGTVSAIPIAPAGLGTFDVTYKALYETLTPTLTVANEGFLVALLFRVMCLVAATIGVVFFWTSRRQIRNLSNDRSTISAPT